MTKSPLRVRLKSDQFLIPLLQISLQAQQFRFYLDVLERPIYLLDSLHQMLFRSFAGAAAVVRSASVIRQSPTLTKLARAIPIRPSPIVLAQRSLAHVTLDHLAPAPGKKKRRIVGRGRGSKRGGHTSGRGHNGAKARGTGNPYVGFEGGQTPLYKKIPKRGFNNKSVILISYQDKSDNPASERSIDR